MSSQNLKLVLIEFMAQHHAAITIMLADITFKVQKKLPGTSSKTDGKKSRTDTENTIAAKGIKDLLRHLGNLGKTALRVVSYLGKKDVQTNEKMGNNDLKKSESVLEVAANAVEIPVGAILEVLRFCYTRKILYLGKIV